MNLYFWKLSTPEESRKLPTTVAMECPHCGMIIKIAAGVINEYLKEGAKIIQFRCPEPECMSNSQYSDDIDRPLFDITEMKNNQKWLEEDPSNA